MVIVQSMNNMQRGYIIMNKRSLFKPSKLSVRSLVYGLYACLCHSVAVCFFAIEVRASWLPCGLSGIIAPMLEHTLMSVALTVGGAVLIDLSVKEKDSK